MVFCRCVIEPNSKVKLCLLYQAFSSFFAAAANAEN